MNTTRLDLIAKFNDLIEHPDEARLVEIIDQLGSIPDEESPIRKLATEGNSDAIQHFVQAAKIKATETANSLFEEKIIEMRKQVLANTDLLMSGKELKKTNEKDTIDAIAKMAFIKYQALVAPIYRNEVYVYAQTKTGCKGQQLFRVKY